MTAPSGERFSTRQRVLDPELEIYAGSSTSSRGLFRLSSILDPFCDCQQSAKGGSGEADVRHVARETRSGYFREVLISPNLVLRLPPIPLTAAMIASEIPAAIRPYSMAVAPDSSFRKRAKSLDISSPC